MAEYDAILRESETVTISKTKYDELVEGCKKYDPAEFEVKEKDVEDDDWQTEKLPKDPISEE